MFVSFSHVLGSGRGEKQKNQEVTLHLDVFVCFGGRMRKRLGESETAIGVREIMFVHFNLKYFLFALVSMFLFRARDVVGGPGKWLF